MTSRDRSYDVITVLEGQHAEIRQAFRRAAQPGRGHGPAFRRLVRLLSIHEAAEEAHVHPAARGVTGPAVAAARHREETQAKRLLARLQPIGPDGDGYLRGLSTLRRAVLAHAAREEREEFPALRRLRPLRRRMLGVEVRLAAYARPLPGAVHRVRRPGSRRWLCAPFRVAVSAGRCAAGCPRARTPARHTGRRPPAAGPPPRRCISRRCRGQLVRPSEEEAKRHPGDDEAGERLAGRPDGRGHEQRRGGADEEQAEGAVGLARLAGERQHTDGEPGGAEQPRPGSGDRVAGEKAEDAADGLRREDEHHERQADIGRLGDRDPGQLQPGQDERSDGQGEEGEG